MSRKYDREENLIERLEKENRELKSLNKSLMKRLKTVSRGYYKFLAEEDQDEKDNIIQKAVKEVEKICWTCKVGVLYKVDLGFRYYRQCNNCSYRTKSKPCEVAKKTK